MKNALFAMALMLVGAAACGGSDSSPMDNACDKLQSCQTLSTVLPAAKSAAECKQTAGAAISTVPTESRDFVDQAINSCLKEPDCAAVTACFAGLMVLMPKTSTP